MNINGVEIGRGLIIDEPWIGLILSGEKTCEMRTTKTNVRGPIALIRKGSGLIVGTVNITGCGEANRDEMYLELLKRRHCIDYEKNPDLMKWCVPWFLSDAKEIEPIPYEHKQGAVIWVKL